MGNGTAGRNDTTAMSVRELVDELSRVDRELRGTPLLVRRSGTTAINPAVAPLLQRQRQLVAQLRTRRTSWARAD
ncbi:MAG: hypothetical protein WB473_11655, partial [Pedococcus sp.]